MFRGGLDDRVHAEHQRARDKYRAGRVGSVAEADPFVALNKAVSSDRRQDRDRDVDEEDPVPVDGLRQDPAGQQADRAARRRDEPVDADRLGLVPWFGEHHDDHPQDDRRGHRAADALDEARDDEHLL